MRFSAVWELYTKGRTKLPAPSKFVYLGKYGAGGLTTDPSKGDDRWLEVYEAQMGPTKPKDLELPKRFRIK